MPRKRDIEDRVKDVTDVRNSATRKMKKAPTKRKQLGEHVEGDTQFHKQIACVLKVAGYPHSKIGAVLGYSRGTVGAWFDEKEVKTYYLALLENLAEGARTLLASYTIEAVQKLAELMRQTDDMKLAFDAAKEILDRGGLPKLSRMEKQVDTSSTSEHKVRLDDPDGLLDKFHELSPDEQSRIAGVMQEADLILAEAAAEEGINGDTD